MSFLDRLERIFGRFAIPNISIYIVIGQVFVLLTYLMGVVDLNWFLLVPEEVRQGQWWRLFAFALRPPAPGLFGGYVLTAFSLYLFYLMGSALEEYWGVFRYNLFLFIGYVLTVGVAFLTPGAAATNAFIAGSVFLAFAYLNPDFELSIFFIFPVKIKYLAMITWALYTVQLIIGSWSTRFQVLASAGNVLLFFGSDIVKTMRYRKRRMDREAKFAVDEDEPRHRCHVCGKTDLTNPEMDFRYCSKCAGDQCYCPEHLGNHTHVLTANEPPKK